MRYSAGRRAAVMMALSAGRKRRSSSASGRAHAIRWPSRPWNLTFSVTHAPAIEQHGSVGILVLDAYKGPGDGDLDAELFAKLAPQGRVPVFARLDLTAWELSDRNDGIGGPGPRGACGRTPPRDQLRYSALMRT
jgi:hypothetical protein